MKPLIIVGAGGFAREMMWLASECAEPWEVVGLLDDADHAPGDNVLGVPILGKVADWRKHADKSFVIAVGAPRTRRAIHNRMLEGGNDKPRWATLIHRSLMRSKYVEIGPGSMITAGNIMTTQVRLGAHVIVNLGCTLGHDDVFGDFCTIAPQATISGIVKAGDGVEIGTGATLIQEINLGTGCMIGAGAIVTKDIAENALAIGAPARAIRQLEPF